MKLSRPLLAALLAGTVTLGTVPLAHAAFRETASASASFSAAQLAPPTSLTATQQCSLELGASLVLTWTVSSSTWADGQRLVVTDSTGIALSTQDLAPTTTTATVRLPLVDTGPYTATVRSTYKSWSSTAATATSPGC